MKNFSNVLFISPNYKNRKGGIASVLSLYALHLKEDFNYSASIYFQNIYLSALLFPINFTVIFVKLLIIARIKIVHIHGSHGGSFIRKYIIFLLVKYLFNKKIVYHLHSSHFHKYYNNSSGFVKNRIHSIINNVDLLMVLSEEWQEYFTKTFNPKKIEILENIVKKQVDFVNPVKHDKLRMVFLGKIGERKGIFDLLKALQNNREMAIEHIELLIGGDGDTMRLKKEISKNNLTNITFLGWINVDQKEKVLRDADIYILPSYDEGLPISILEAMSFGKPIIATNVGGIPRIVKDNKNGFLIEPGDINTMWKSICNYIDSAALKKQHGQKSLEIVQDYFPDKVFARLNKLYKEL